MRSFLFVIAGAASSISYAQLQPLTPSLPNLTPSLQGSPWTNVAPAPQVVEYAPLRLLEAVTLPPVIRARRVEMTSSQATDLGRLVTRLSQVDSDILEYRRDVQGESFNNLLEVLQSIVTRRPPNLSSKLEQAIPRISNLLAERRDINQRILRIVDPGVSMSPAPYVEPTRSGPSDSNYQVFSSDQTATGAVVAPTPSPACHMEEQTRREYRTVLVPNGFDGAGTALYRNVYHPFPVTTRVQVCR